MERIKEQDVHDAILPHHKVNPRRADPRRPASIGTAMRIEGEMVYDGRRIIDLFAERTEHIPKIAPDIGAIQMQEFSLVILHVLYFQHLGERAARELAQQGKIASCVLIRELLINAIGCVADIDFGVAEGDLGLERFGDILIAEPLTNLQRIMQVQQVIVLQINQDIFHARPRLLSYLAL